MQAIKEIHHIKNKQLQMRVPKSFDNQDVEVIILPSGKKLNIGSESAAERAPNREIRGKMKVTGDIMDSVPVSSWGIGK